jgi:hypothetical protein
MRSARSLACAGECANWWLTSRVYDDPTSLTGPPQPYSTSPHQTSPTDPPQPYPASDKRKVRIKPSPLQDPHTGRALRARLEKKSTRYYVQHSLLILVATYLFI